MSDSTPDAKDGRDTVSAKEVGFAPASFQAALLQWYDSAARELPWRARPGETADPYKVWLSEIMLQQTTVKAVIPYFDRFVARWPNVAALAEAPRDDVLAAWAGLGYYSRARNLYACAQCLARDGFPGTEEALRKLPGLGAYTAAAVAAIAFGEPAVVVDGNVERVVSRIFAVTTPLPAAKPEVRQLAAILTPDCRPGDYAQAMMDLGATICTPRSPKCLICPVVSFCAAAREGEPARYPVKAQKRDRPVRRGYAFVVVTFEDNEASVLLNRRSDKGLLGGMMEPPCSPWLQDGEAGGSEVAEDAPKDADLHALAGFDLDAIAWIDGTSVAHTFTHFALTLSVKAARIKKPDDPRGGVDRIWAPIAALDEYPLPTVMLKAVRSGLAALGLTAPARSERGD